MTACQSLSFGTVSLTRRSRGLKFSIMFLQSFVLCRLSVSVPYAYTFALSVRPCLLNVSVSVSSSFLFPLLFCSLISLHGIDWFYFHFVFIMIELACVIPLTCSLCVFIVFVFLQPPCMFPSLLFLALVTLHFGLCSLLDLLFLGFDETRLTFLFCPFCLWKLRSGYSYLRSNTTGQSKKFTSTVETFKNVAVVLK